ncbi:MAG: zeta toxin family protein [Candidatus Margulisiibacteriota bacterium]
MSRSKHLYIIAGPNGAGKTTLAKELLEELKDLQFLNADEIAKKISIPLSEFNKARISAGKHFFKELKELIKGHTSFALETTLSGTYLIKEIKKMKKKGYKTSLLYFFVDDPKTAIKRIKARVLKGGHSVPDTDVIRRFYRSKLNLWKLYREIVDDWILFYNGIDKPIKVASGKGNLVKVLDDDLFTFFIKDISDG